jgi:hypothetical protein
MASVHNCTIQINFAALNFFMQDSIKSILEMMMKRRNRVKLSWILMMVYQDETSLIITVFTKIAIHFSDQTISTAFYAKLLYLKK